MSLSDFLELELLDHVFGAGNRDYTSPANIFVALSSTDPGEDGAGITEPSTGGYARQSTDDTDWSIAATESPGPNSVTSITRSGGGATDPDVAVVVTATAHNLLPGNRVTIAGANEADYNGLQVVCRVPSPTSFEYIVTGAPTTPATGTITWEQLSHGVIRNATLVDFGQATADYLAGADLTHFALFDAVSGGNFLAKGELAVAKPILEDDTAQFPANSLETQLQ